MHYPWWHVPLLTAPMLIAIVSVAHVYVSMYAVGGGLFLAAETQHARRTGDRAYLAYLRDHAKFFILLTVVYGAITGVGIWWTIGLASPLATETLIHAFVFGWAIEYVFFAVELAAAFVFYYYWDRLAPRTHVRIGWIYAGAAWISLVLITGITAFMLNSGRWPQTHAFWDGFFNPQFLPQTLARTGGALLLASLYVNLHAALRIREPGLLAVVARRAARPGLLGAALVALGSLWWYAALPASARLALVGAAALNILVMVVLGASGVVLAMLYLGPYRRPGWVTPGFAILLFCFGLAGVGAGEFVREAVRKPFIIHDVIYGNQIWKDEVESLRGRGYLAGGVWTRAWLAARHPEVVTPGGAVDESALAALPAEARLRIGEVLFEHHCNDCHAARAGLSAVAHLAGGWTDEMLRQLVLHPERVQFFMPPWAGTLAEARLLQEYLGSIAEPFPAGLPRGDQFKAEPGAGGRADAR